MDISTIITWLVQLVGIILTDPNKPGRTFLIFFLAIFSSWLTVSNEGWYWLPVPAVGIMVLAFFIKGVTGRKGVEQ